MSPRVIISQSFQLKWPHNFSLKWCHVSNVFLIWHHPPRKGPHPWYVVETYKSSLPSHFTSLFFCITLHFISMILIQPRHSRQLFQPYDLWCFITGCILCEFLENTLKENLPICWTQPCVFGCAFKSQLILGHHHQRQIYISQRIYFVITVTPLAVASVLHYYWSLRCYTTHWVCTHYDLHKPLW